MRDTSPSNRNTVKFNVFSYTHTEPVLQAFRHSGSCLTLPVADTQGKNNKSSYKPIAHSPALQTIPDGQAATEVIITTIINTDMSAYPTWQLHPGPTQAGRHARSGFKAGAMWGFVFDIVLFVIPGTDEATMSAPLVNWMAATLEGALAFGLLGALIGAGVSLAQSKKSFVTSLKRLRAKRTTPALINPATRFVASGQRDTGA
jgi:hypothetical protein